MRSLRLIGFIVARDPNLIVTGTNPRRDHLMAATSTIPIVAFMIDPLKAGLVTRLARPGRNRAPLAQPTCPIGPVIGDTGGSGETKCQSS